MRVMKVRRPDRLGLSRSQMASTSSAVVVGPSLQPTGFWMPRTELHVGAVELPVRSPIQTMCGGVEPVTGEGVAAGQRLLVAEDERFVAGEEVDLVQARHGTVSTPQAFMNHQGTVDLVGHVLVASTFGALHHEALRPRVDLGQIAKPPLVRERSRFSVAADWW